MKPGHYALPRVRQVKLQTVTSKYAPLSASVRTGNIPFALGVLPSRSICHTKPEQSLATDVVYCTCEERAQLEHSLPYHLLAPPFLLHRFCKRDIYHYHYVLSGKDKAISVTAHGSPYGCETSRLSHFIDNRLRDGGEDDSLMRRPPFPPPPPPGRFLLRV
jgi:hypothetical protein